MRFSGFYQMLRKLRISEDTAVAAIWFARRPLGKELAEAGFHFLKPGVFDLAGSVENNALFHCKEALRAYEAVQREPSAFKINHEQRHGLAVIA